MKTAPPIVSDMTCFRPMIRFIHCHVYWDKNRLQRTVRSAEKIIGANLPTIQGLYTSRVRKRAGKITADPLHPGHKLFKLPSGRRCRSLFAKTSRHKNCFFPLAVSLLSNYPTVAYIFIYLSLHFSHSTLLLCTTVSQLLYIAIPPCEYTFLNFLTVALFVLYCIVL